MAGTLSTHWPKEGISDDDWLYMRVHVQWLLPDGSPKPGAFRNHPPEKKGGLSMSTDWSKYASPEDARRRARVPVENAVIRMRVGVVRRVPRQRVEHSPDVDHRAHTDVVGPKDNNLEARLKLLEASDVVISATNPL